MALVRDGNDEQKASAARALGHLLRSACGRAMANLEHKYCYPCHSEAQFVKRAEHDHLPWDDYSGQMPWDYWGQMEEYAEVTQMVSEAEDTGVKRDRAFPPEWDFRVFMVRHIGEAGGIPPLVALVRDGNDDQKRIAVESRSEWRKPSGHRAGRWHPSAGGAGTRWDGQAKRKGRRRAA